MTERGRLQGTTVDEIHETDLQRGTIVSHTTSIADVTETLDYRPDLEAVYVVDTRDRYAGIVTTTDVLAWMDHNLPATGDEDGARVAEGLRETAIEEARNPASGRVLVEPTAPVEHGLQRMREGNLPVIPVVEPDGSIVGELTLTRVLTHILREH